jgi:hypothetical protein
MNGGYGNVEYAGVGDQARVEHAVTVEKALTVPVSPAGWRGVFWIRLPCTLNQRLCVLLLEGIALDDSPKLCIGRLMCRMHVMLVVAVPLKELGVRCAFDAVAAETVDDAHMRASFSEC